MLQLRPYQQAAIDAVYEHLRTRDDNAVVVILTAGGKTPLIASICKDVVGLWQGRVLILAHVQELLEQTADKLRTVSPDIPFGVYSAGLRSRDTTQPVIVAGIQSAWRKGCEFGTFDLVLVDEAHVIPHDGDAMYQNFLCDARRVNPNVRVIGFTATPYRMRTGSICKTPGLLNRVCFEVGVRELIRDGYLCPLISKAGQTKFAVGGLHARDGEFVAEEVERLMDADALVEAACSEIVNASRDRNACLIFASGVKHGEHIARVLKAKHGLSCGFVTGDTPAAERERLLTGFKAGEMKYLANIHVLTTGFDAPNIDCVAMLRPTLSPGLYYQMVGRGFRLHPSKTDSLILDFAGNVLRHGPVDQLRGTRPGGTGEAPAKQCPQCNALIATGYARCPHCGHEFPPPVRTRHDSTATDAAVLSGQVRITQHRLTGVTYTVHRKRDATEDAPRTMRVEYRLDCHKYQSEWVCLEHSGYPREKGVTWWRERSLDPVPDTAEEAVALAESGRIAPTLSVTVRRVSGEKYGEVVDHELGHIPEPIAEPAQPDTPDSPLISTDASVEEQPW